MSFRFAYPALLFFAIAVAGWLAFRIWKKPPALTYSMTSQIAKLAGGSHSFISKAPLILRTLCLILLVVTAARPQLYNVSREVKSPGVDIMLCLDTSGSMQALDFEINGEPVSRLTAVKKVVSDFVKKRETDRIGLVVFGEEAFTQSPLTLDKGLLLELVGNMEIGMAGDRTAIGSAIAIGGKRLKDLPAKSKILIVLTDGRQNAGDVGPEQAAEAVNALGVKIYSIGVGGTGSAPFPVDTPLGKRIVRRKVDLDENTLRHVAEKGGGKYFRAADSKQLAEIYNIIDREQKTEVKVKEFFSFSRVVSLFPDSRAVAPCAGTAGPEHDPEVAAMTMTRWWTLHFLWLLPLIALFLVIGARRKKKALERFADQPLLPRLTGQERDGAVFLKNILLLATLALILLALAGPRWGSHYQEVSQKGVDIMVAVDVSTSMLVQDVKPDRLERAKREIVDLVKVIRGDRVGLVAFSGAAFTQCPLTLDYGAVTMFLNALEPDLIPVPGTDLGAAIETCLASFDFKANSDKTIILITDGEDNEQKGLEAAREAAAKGVKIFIFGIGDPSGGPVPHLDGKGGFKKDAQGNLVLSKLDEKGLEEIASITGGVYTRSDAGDFDLDTLYFDGIKSLTRDETLKSGKIKVYEERFAIFVFAAFIILLIEGFVLERKQTG